MDHDHLARKYVKLEPRDHVLTRPGMYIGSVESDRCETWVLDESCPGKPIIVKRDIIYVPGLYKIYDEIISNAIDHATRVEAEFPDDPKAQVRNIKVTIERDTGIIEVFNDGPGIDVEIHPEHGVYVPELIFGHMLTSANYDDSTGENGEGGRMVGGMNGLGAKCCNIFSEWFEVETVDATRKKIFKQRFRENMSAKATPSVRACAKRPYTRIRFLPQYSRFGCEGITDDVYALFVKRACDACALTGPGVNVFLNSVKLEYKSFERYVDMYLGPKSERPRVYEKINDRWEIVAAVAEEPGFEQMSFVNGIWTMRGGKHVEYVTSQICKKLCDVLVAKKKLANVRPPFVKERLVLFVKCTITNPMFDSQSKETLTTPATRFGGGRVEVSDAFIEKLSKTGIAELVAEAAAGASAKALAKSDGAKRSTVRGIPKLHDAAWAGTKDKSQDAVLCLVEGDSAAAMAIAGRSAAVNGTQRYGIFSLKGKLLNTRDAALQKIADNAEICAIKRILGLQTGKQYDDTRDLRYGGILLLTDADADGVHIQGLIMNLFGSQWPSLLLCPGFIRAMRTPIVKASKGKAVHQFYDLQEFQRWKQQETSSGGFVIKYYKGLATSSSAEAKEYFRTPRIAEFRHEGSGCSEGLDLAFNKKRADERKAWLEGYEPPGEDGTGTELDYSQGSITFDQFVNQGLITFSIYDVARSLPSVVDGLKVSQRKILYACFKRTLVKEIRVAQLSGYVSEATLYHHGEASLQGAIIGMAQNFTGGNNINLLMPNGQFGTRLQGGKDAGSARYIHTCLNPVTRKLFVPDDDQILTYRDDDGTPVEPVHYIPIIPMVLVNGALGIGTGFSCTLPCFNPSDVVARIRALLEGTPPKDLEPIVPWYRGHTGRMVQLAENKFMSMGVWERTSPAKVRITELPVGTWTDDYRTFLEAHVEATPDIKSFDAEYTDEIVRFTITFASAQALEARMTPHEGGMLSKMEHELKLSSTRNLSLTNMYMFSAAGRITKYDSPIEIISEFFDTRLDAYSRRREALLIDLRTKLRYVCAKVMFIEAIIEGSLSIMNTPKDRLEADLEEQEYPRLSVKSKDESDDEGSYAYLLNMPVSTLTKEKKAALEAQKAEMDTRLKALEATSPEEMWKSDLDAFVACLEKKNM